MGLETSTYVNGLNANNPASTDGLAQADDHLRLIKGTITATFPNLDAAVTADPTELNILDGAIVTTDEVNHLSGVTSAIQTQLDDKASTTSPTITTATLVSPTITDATLSGTTTLASVAVGAFEIVEGGGRLNFTVSGTTVMSLDTSGNLRVIGDIVGFDSTA